MDFKKFIEKENPEFLFEKDNASLIEKLNLWGLRSSNFEKMGKDYHLDKGLVLCGEFGTGKTEIFRMLNLYILAMRSPYIFSTAYVTELADRMQQTEYPLSILANLSINRNYCFDELAFKDEFENKAFPIREKIQSFGNKILVGQNIIHTRYRKWRETGYQTHFITNRFPKELKTIYGEAAYDRLLEMCNFMDLQGTNKRKIQKSPKFIKRLI